MDYYSEHYFDDIFADEKPSKINRGRYNYFNDAMEAHAPEKISQKEDNDISSLIDIFK